MLRAILILFIASTMSLNVSGQGIVQTDYIKWSFELKKAKKAGEYLVIAHAELKPEWHIFDLNPGGDGLLIAPEFSFEDKNIKLLGVSAKGNVITTTFTGVDGDVRYHEKEVSFVAQIRSNNKKIKGSIYYQICDHEKCLAPTEEAFELLIK